MHALNIKKKDTQKQTKPVFDFSKDSLEDIINSNIDNKLLSKNNYLQLSKHSVSTF